MVQRTSQPVDFTQGSQNQILQPTGGYVSPDVRAEYTPEVDNGRDRILAGILNEAEQTARKGFKRSLEDAYLEGVAKVGTIESEAELEGDMFSRDWKVAGYRDTMGKFAVADAEAQLAKDMTWLRQETPEKFQEYMTEYRKKLTPTLEGMSREQRNAAFNSLVTSTRSAIKTHTAEHQKFIIETEQKAVSSVLGTKFTNLTKSLQSLDPSYGSKVDDTLAAVYGNIWKNPKFAASPGLQNKLTVQAMEYALSTNNTVLYEKMRDMQLDIGGKQSSMFNALTLDEQEKLAEKYRVAMDRTAGQRNTLWDTNNVNLMVGIENGTVSMTVEEFVKHQDQGMSLGALSPERRRSDYEAFVKAAYKNGNEAVLADAYLTNKSDVIAKYGDPEKALKAAEKAFQKAGMTQPQIMAQHLRAADNGNTVGFKAAGGVANSAIAQLARANGTMDPKHEETFAAVNDFLDRNQNNEVAKVGFLSGMSDANKTRILRLRELKSQGVEGDAAVAALLKSETNDATMTPQQKAAIATGSATDDRKFLQSIDSRGPVGSAWNSLKSMWSPEARLRGAASPREPFWNNIPNQVQAQYLDIQKGAVQEEFMAVDLVSSNLSQDSRYTAALSGLANRTVSSKNAGPIVLPRGASIHSYLGVNASPEAIGRAFDELLKPEQDGERYVVRPQRGGFVVQKYNKDGTPMTTGGNFIEASTVAEVHRKQVQAESAQADLLHGEGRSAKVGNVRIRYNGSNSASVAPDLMLQFRDNLRNNEGFRDTVYKDTVGVLTLGIGVSEKSSHWPKGAPLKEGDKVPAQLIQESFRGASNDAARLGSEMQRAVGLSDSGFLFAAEVAYHGGSITSPKHYTKPVWEALLNRDVEKAKQEFMQTKVYKLAGDSRKKHYLKLLDQSLKG